MAAHSIPVIIAAGITIYVGIYYLFMFIKVRKDRANLTFSLACFSAAFYDITCVGLYNAPSPAEGMRWQVGNFTGIGLMSIFFIWFVIDYTRHTGRKFAWILTVFFSLCIVLILFIDGELTFSIDHALPKHIKIGEFINITYNEVDPGIIPTVELLSTILGFVYLLVLNIKHYRIYKTKETYAIIGSIFLFFFAAVLDTFTALGAASFLYMTEYAFFCIILTMSYAMLNRFVGLHIEVEELNRSLEYKVEDRTRELQQTLSTVKLLKEQQDGDYFLTTLLVRPLATLTPPVSEKIQLAALIQQKKKFEYRNRNYEIGGDICITDTIQLKGRNYTVFVNGDAMGKSIQGAGGAIVLGVVFKSLVSRTKMYPAGRNLFPERWLKIALIELQNIFITFDGQMLISLVMGLIDHENGMLYFINAEHPWTVLYRDGKAAFLENSLSFHKIGLAGLQGKIRVQTFRMHTNDVILIGSDGRDDILIRADKDQKPLINENENVFLETIEEASGNLEKILEITTIKGEITDDFSILRLGYNELDVISDSPEGDDAALAAAEEFIKAEKFQQALDLLLPHCDAHPEDSRSIFLAGQCLEKNGDSSGAKDFGERLRLRDPGNREWKDFLINLYTKTGNTSRARKLSSQE